jgi:hypothetical protein
MARGGYRIGEHVGWLDHDAIAALRANLGPGAVAAAAATARARPLDELIIQPAEIAID